ncbi:syntaxin binding protein 1 [Echinococcus multilocularis]|uniref:Syntaxin binding protein 1 n=1 Tax=Echinococcus multilocularis TaxID=6211 RepID=A0A068Y0N9_ECHMU|nr:syntaxin binding protein 1 [Echinococcus multilocularis]
MEAIYLLEPCKDSVSRLLRDFTNNPKNYTAAYVYFTIACSDEILKQISVSGCVRYFKALTVLNIGFLPIESHIFSINCHETAWLYTCPVDRVPDMNNRLESLAEQIATLCVTLNEYPKIRYRKRSSNLELAQFIQLKLTKHKGDNPQLGQGLHKDRSILLLLDRGFDPLTPLLHDLTLQSLTRDLKEITGNSYKYGKGQEYELTDKDKLWKELRNEHIADVSKSLPTRLRAFAESKRHFLASTKKADEIASGASSLRGSQESINSVGTTSSGVVNYGTDVPPDANSNASRLSSAAHLRALQAMVHEMPQYQKEAASYNALVSITDYCLSACRENINNICTVEQDLVMGQTAHGDTLPDPMMSLVNILKPDSMTEVDRFRLILIYVITQGGILEANLEKLLDYARLSLTYKSLVAAMSSIMGARLISSVDGSFDSPLFRGLPSLASAPSFIQYYLPTKGKRLRDVDENSYALSRWVPYLDDLLEKCISDSLDSQCFPYLPGVQGSLSKVGSSLKPPDQLAAPNSSDLRGPSARFRAPSPQPPSTTRTGGSEGPAGGIPTSPDLSNRQKQRSDSGRSTVNADDSIFGETSMSDHCGPRLIVFVVGGITWPETRVCYSVTQRCMEARLAASDKSSGPTTGVHAKNRSHLGRHSRKSSGLSLPPSQPSNQHVLKNGGGAGWNWEVILGGTGVLTPKQFIANLQNLVEYS